MKGTLLRSRDRERKRREEKKSTQRDLNPRPLVVKALPSIADINLDLHDIGSIKTHVATGN